MSRLIDDVRTELKAAGFATLLPRPDSLALHFEDISIMGQIHVLGSADEIVTKWQVVQDEFLKHNASRFLRDATKAWNLYTILLTAQTPAPEVAARLFSIEDDFRGTRKIARAGVTTREDVAVALAPILPLRNVLAVGIVDAKERLVERLGAVTPVLCSLVNGVPPESIVATLLGRE